MTRTHFINGDVCERARAEAGRASRTRSSTRPSPTRESLPTRVVLVSVAILYISLFLFTPLIAVFAEGFRNGVQAFFTAIAEKDALAARCRLRQQLAEQVLRSVAGSRVLD